ncbi:MAG: transposase [Rhodobacteraceae bacterium]|nr:transposase [Paracoccaceae bacterium]
MSLGKRLKRTVQRHLRREVFNAERFTTTKQAQIVIKFWIKECNRTRPHQALGMRPPVPEILIRHGP